MKYAALRGPSRARGPLHCGILPAQQVRRLRDALLQALHVQWPASGLLLPASPGAAAAAWLPPSRSTASHRPLWFGTLPRSFVMMAAGCAGQCTASSKPLTQVDTLLPCRAATLEPCNCFCNAVSTTVMYKKALNLQIACVQAVHLICDPNTSNLLRQGTQPSGLPANPAVDRQRNGNTGIKCKQLWRDESAGCGVKADGVVHRTVHDD